MNETAAAGRLTSLGACRPAARSWVMAAILWLACVLALGVHQWHFWQHGRLNADVLALLPQDEQAPDVADAGRILSEGVARQVVVLLGAPDWAGARHAAGAWRAAIAASGVAMRPAGDAAGADPDTFLGFYRPWRDHLLTAAQRARLQQASVPALVQASLVQLHRPGMGVRLQDFAADPLGLWGEWLAARAGQSKARPRDGELWVGAGGLHWLVLRYEITGSPFAMSGDAVYGPALQQALDAARRDVPGVRMLAAGLPLHAEAAAVQASREVGTIGWGSLAAVLLLAWLAFRGLTPILLVALSLVIGVAAALSVTAWWFGEVHLLTLVFGASLVGVAEDYGIHYFAARQTRPEAQPLDLMRVLLPGLVLALATSVLAYLALGLAPFPGLRQIAVFSAAGLTAAFLTAVCWFPLLDRGKVRHSAFARRIAGSLTRWPRLVPSRGILVGLGTLTVLALAGVARLEPVDDIRHWQSSPADLLRAQADVGRLLGVPSVAQFYLVRGDSPQQLLEREEALKTRLDALVGRGVLAGYAAVSDWLPSVRRQLADAALVAQVESQVLAGVNAALGETLVRPLPKAGAVEPDAWLQHGASAAARGLWLGESAGQWRSVVLLHGVDRPDLLPQLAAAARDHEGVRWVNKSGDVVSLLGRYRWAMAGLLLVAHALVFSALWWRYRVQAWRAWAPTAGATLLALGCLGWMGEPFQLSTVLALLLLLGIGVDYGIFLLEHDGEGAAWLAVVLGAASTWLAFGLLALSATPALHAFGLTLMLGIACVWVMSPWLRRASPGVGA